MQPFRLYMHELEWTKLGSVRRLLHPDGPAGDCRRSGAISVRLYVHSPRVTEPPPHVHLDANLSIPDFTNVCISWGFSLTPLSVSYHCAYITSKPCLNPLRVTDIRIRLSNKFRRHCVSDSYAYDHRGCSRRKRRHHHGQGRGGYSRREPVS